MTNSGRGDLPNSKGMGKKGFTAGRLREAKNTKPHKAGGKGILAALKRLLQSDRNNKPNKGR
jgi:hypothetical protein